MRNFFLLFYLFTMNLCADIATLFDLEKEGFEQYQDVYAQGVVLKKASYAERFMEKRFEIINSILEQYNRPFTLLDVGAAQGYFSIRAAEKYPESVFVMLEGSNPIYPKISLQLASICKLNNHLKNLIWLDKPLFLKDLKDCSACEHFDVILLLNIIHWMPNEWKEVINTAFSMSHITILEVPPLEDSLPEDQLQLRKQIHEYLTILASRSMQGVPRHTNPSLYSIYYILENQGPFRLEKTTLIHPDFGDRNHLILCDYQTKQLKKEDLKEPYLSYLSNWEPGINLITYLMLHGNYPSKKELIDCLPEDYSHKDWMLNNMILQGKKLILIDQNDQKNELGGVGSHIYNPLQREAMKRLILLEDPKKFKKDFFDFVQK